MRVLIGLACLAACGDDDHAKFRRVADELQPVIARLAPKVLLFLPELAEVPATEDWVGRATVACTGADDELYALRRVDFDEVQPGSTRTTIAEDADALLDYRHWACRASFSADTCATWCAKAWADLIDALRGFQVAAKSNGVDVELGPLRAHPTR